MKNAIVILSGGLDSSTCLAIAKEQGFIPFALTFNYGQKHQVELRAAKNIAQKYAKEHRIIDLPIGQFGGSALTDNNIDVPEHDSIRKNEIPVTYVPARNTIFLSIALGYAETIKSCDIFLGISGDDYENYPDCRPEYIEAFEKMAHLATKAGLEGARFHIHTPLIGINKAKTIQWGSRLGMDYKNTISCYNANENGEACGACQSCRLRKKGFEQAQIVDPTKYYSK